MSRDYRNRTQEEWEEWTKDRFHTHETPIVPDYHTGFIAHARHCGKTMVRTMIPQHCGKTMVRTMVPQRRDGARMYEYQKKTSAMLSIIDSRRYGIVRPSMTATEINFKMEMADKGFDVIFQKWQEQIAKRLIRRIGDGRFGSGRVDTHPSVTACGGGHDDIQREKLRDQLSDRRPVSGGILYDHGGIQKLGAVAVYVPSSRMADEDSGSEDGVGSWSSDWIPEE